MPHMFIFISFIKFGKISAIIQIFSLLLSFSSSWDSQMYILVCLLSHRSQTLFTLFSLFYFLLLRHDNFIVLSSHSCFLSSSCPNLPLNPSSEFFILVIILFSPGGLDGHFGELVLPSQNWCCELCTTGAKLFWNPPGSLYPFDQVPGPPYSPA